MQVRHTPLYQFLEGASKSFIIPVYQRDYAWTKQNCQKLWDDIVDLCQNNRNDHFLGTLVTVGKGMEEFTVIDGQQRLTTISILIKALHSYIQEHPEKDSSGQNLTEQLQDFLINKYSVEQSEKIRLKPNKQDRAYFESLFADTEDTLKADSNIVSNYQFFLRKIQSEEISPVELFTAFKRLTIVWIDLHREQDDPQLIFESLNSTGVDLTPGDLIRNYILMDLAPEEQEMIYKQYWVPIEQNTGNIAEFVKHFLNYSIQKSITWREIYEYFKKYARDELANNKVELVKKLFKFSKLYATFEQIEEHDIPAINHQLERIKNIGFSTCYPYLFSVFSYLESGVITEKEVVEVLKLVEAHYFRKVLVDNSTQGFNKMYVILAKEIEKEPNWKTHYVDILKYTIREKRGAQRIPNNEEFTHALRTKDLYHLNGKNKNFLFSSLENYESGYTVDIESLTIEHIMPQTLSTKWKEFLGDNWEQIHKKYVHTLGNLSLTSCNSALSNNTIEEKQKIDFQKSKLKLNYGLDSVEDWNEESIRERSKHLIDDAISIWKYPETTYTKTVPDLQKFDLSSEESFTNKKPDLLFLDEEENGIKIKTWKEILVHVCKFLYDFSPTEFNIAKEHHSLSQYFDTAEALNEPKEFSPGLFVASGFDANRIMRISRTLAERMSYPLDNIQFSIK